MTHLSTHPYSKTPENMNKLHLDVQVLKYSLQTSILSFNFGGGEALLFTFILNIGLEKVAERGQYLGLPVGAHNSLLYY